MRTPLVLSSFVHRVLAIAALVLPALAAADPAARDDAELAQRATAELAADGVVLARRGVVLRVERIGDRLLISLVDRETGRAAASTTLDRVPDDGAAAIASVTQLAAGLVAQLAPAGEPDRDRARRELAYRKSALSFGDELVVSGDGESTTTTRNWVVYQGELHRRLEAEQFYSVIGRPELGALYRERVRRGIAGIATGGGLVLAGGVYALTTLMLMDHCSTSDPNFGDCVDAEDGRVARTIGIGVGVSLVGVVVGAVGIHYLRTAHPISEAEAQQLGEGYNDDLRRRHGLPTAQRELRLAPYASASGAGVALGGEF